MARDKTYTNQVRRTQRRLKGRMVDGQLIIKVGAPVDARRNAPSLVPFQLKNGRFGIFWDADDMRPLITDNPKAQKAIERSTRMPNVAAGIGSDVMHIWVYPKKKNIKYAVIKVYYNHKAGRGDSYQEVTFKKAAENAEARKQQALAA